MTRLADTPPYCASCFGQYPDRAHVDFEAAYDGPVLEGSIKSVIDDLILCESCVAEAARLLGWAPPGDVEAERVEALEDAVRGWRAMVDEAVAYNAKLLAALAAHPLEILPPDPDDEPDPSEAALQEAA